MKAGHSPESLLETEKAYQTILVLQPILFKKWRGAFTSLGLWRGLCVLEAVVPIYLIEYFLLIPCYFIFDSLNKLLLSSYCVLRFENAMVHETGFLKQIEKWKIQENVN